MRILEIPEGTTEIKNYEYRGLKELEQVLIPNSVKKIGKHAFYDCRNLKSIRISGNLHEIEDGAFKNCDSLRYVEVTADDRETGCMKNIVADLSHEIVFHIQYSDGQARLLVPSYSYDYEIDINSRVFHEVVYGSGDAYQRCVSKEKINFGEYDFLFSVAKREEQEPTLFELITDRLEYPYQLEEKAKERYLAYLKEHAVSYVKQKIESNDQKGLRLAADCGLFRKEDMEEYLELAGKEKKIESMAFLMEYQNQHFPVILQEFEF